MVYQSTRPLRLAPLLLLLIYLVPCSSSKGDNHLFHDCDIPEHYASLLSREDNALQNWTRNDLYQLVQSQHRNILPVQAAAVYVMVGRNRNSTKPHDTNANDIVDLYQALIALDPGYNATTNTTSREGATVQLLYLQMAANATGYPAIWEAERLWSSFDLITNAAAFTDVHHIRPAASRLLKEKKQFNFGMCGTVSTVDKCQQLFHNTTTTYKKNENATTAQVQNGTVEFLGAAQDDKIWQPPEVVRGEIARALLYMDLRYHQNLQLDDCGPFLGQGQSQPQKLGYLSQLLQWHHDYPPSAREQVRNDKVCRRFQGNRNPFVDFPALAEIIHGSPQERIGRTYASCLEDFEEYYAVSDATEEEVMNDTLIDVDADVDANDDKDTSTTPVFAPWDPCASIGNGTLPFFLVNTKDPDEVIFLALEEIAGDLELYLTDEAWNGQDFVQDVPDEGAVVVSN